jgi:hypothetical protein
MVSASENFDFGIAGDLGMVGSIDYSNLSDHRQMIRSDEATSFH